MSRKLLQINVTANWGSTGRIAEEIGVAAINAGWKSYIAYGRQCNPGKSQLIKIGSQVDVYRHVLLTKLFDRHGLASKHATRKFISIVTNLKPDLVHLHNIHGYYLNYPVLFDFLKACKIPVVWTLHDCWAFTGHCAYFSSIGCEKWKEKCGNCKLLSSYPVSLFDNSIKNLVLKKHYFGECHDMTLVPVSDWLKGLVLESFLARNDIHTIHNGIDTNVFKPNKRNNSGKFIILGVANKWEQRKGLSSFYELRKELDDYYDIVLVGLSKKQIKSLPKGIKGIERTNSVEELAELYSMADAFVNPTYEDNFPTTNIEALACGTPVITYDTGGSPEAVDKSTGFVVDKGDIAGIVDAIGAIKERGRDYWRKACRHRAEQCFNKDRQYEQYIELYDRILSRK